MKPKMACPAKSTCYASHLPQNPSTPFGFEAVSFQCPFKCPQNPHDGKAQQECLGKTNSPSTMDPLGLFGTFFRASSKLMFR